MTTIRLGDLLVQRGIITPEQLHVALEEHTITREKLGEILVRFGFVDRKGLVASLVTDSGFGSGGECFDPECLLRDGFISEASIDVDIPKRLLVELQAMVLGDTGCALYVSTINRNPRQVVERLTEYLKGSREVSLISTSYNTIFEYLQKLQSGDVADDPEVDEDDINLLINRLFFEAMNEHASDVHIETTEKSIHIRTRIDGILHIAKVLPVKMASRLFSRIKDISGMDVSEKRLPQDGSFSLTYRGRSVDFRAATLPTAHGEKVTVRILDKESAVMDIRKLGITCVEDWLALTRMRNGLILVCGATGSGKTTTLYSTVQYLDTLQKSVYMIEEPIEYRIPFITQVQVNRKVGLDFAAFSRTVLRHDPDVAIVGEIRDRETAENAMRMADTGHLVYGTLHTNDVPSTLIRLQDLGIKMNDLSFVLRGVLVQHLVRKICPDCGKAGCEACRHTGYRGRTLMSEFIKVDGPDDLNAYLNREKVYHTFQDDARIKLSEGITDEAEILRAIGEWS